MLKQQKHKTPKQAQTTVEYLLLFAFVLFVLIIFLARGGFFERTLNRTLEFNSNYMLESADNIFNIEN